MRLLRNLLILTVLTIVGMLVLGSIFLSMIISDDPLVIAAKNTRPESFISIKRDIRQIVEGLNSDNRQKIVSMKHSQVQEIFAVASHILPLLEANYNHSGTLILVACSFKLPDNPFGEYLNLSSEFIDPLNILTGSTKIGSMSFSNNWIYRISLFIISFVIDKSVVAAIEQVVAGASYSDENILLEVPHTIDTRALVAILKNDAKTFSTFIWDKDEYSNVGRYYRLLNTLSSSIKGLNQKIALYDYLIPLFEDVERISNRNSQPVNENVNAIFALGLFVGEYKLKSLLGQITGIKASSYEPPVTLGGRTDLARHFIYSAVIQVLGSKEFSFSIGEIKEISDMDFGGSGFSFADLAADRAGVHFISLATENQQSASHLQSFILNSQSEMSFFPDLFLLEEKLSLADFKINYQDTSSEQYQRIITEIDHRVFQLPLFTSNRQ